MHPSPATVAALLLIVAAALVIALAAIAVRPSPQGPTVQTQAAPGAHPRVHGRDPSSARRTPRHRAGRRNARPAPSPTPGTVVATYYRALDAGRFDAAWTILTPAVRASFGDFERWRDGYATTLSSSPRDIEVATDGAVATIAHELVTEDRSSCGPVRRRFAVRWKLVRVAGGWRAASLTGVERAGGEPATACLERHDAARAAGGS